jgi:hypothetical protein
MNESSFSAKKKERVAMKKTLPDRLATSGAGIPAVGRKENPHIQMILPMTEVVGLLLEGVGHLMRESRVGVDDPGDEEEVRHLAGERHEQHLARRAHRWGKKLVTAWWTGKGFRFRERVCAGRKIPNSGWASTKRSSAMDGWNTLYGTR